MATRTVDPDELLAQGEPSQEEIDAVNRDEARGKADTVPPAPRRGPGRPPGSRTKKSTAARAAGSTTRPTVDVPPARPLTGAAKAAADRRAIETMSEAKQDRAMRIMLYGAFMRAHRVDAVKGVSMAMGIPADVLIGAEPDPANPTQARIGEDGRPILALTELGAMLAPTDGQIKIVAEAGARLTETEQGRQLLAYFEKLAPYAYSAGAIAAIGMYAVTTFKASGQIKEMLAAQQLVHDDVQPPAPGAPSPAPGAGAPPSWETAPPVARDIGVDPASAVV